MEVLRSRSQRREATLLHRTQTRITLHKRLSLHSRQEYTVTEAMSPNVFPNRVDFRLAEAVQAAIARFALFSL